MTAIPKTMRALIKESSGKAVIANVPLPTLETNDILVKVEYAALNPTDWKHIDAMGTVGAIHGMDFTGTVVSLGKSLRNDSIRVGDKITSTVHGGKFPDKGSFAEYLRAESDLVWKIPEGSGLLDVASFGVGYNTAAQAVYLHQGIAWPPSTVSTKTWYLISGGSTSVGLFAIQLATLAGYSVICTASPRSFALCKSYGAAHVVDYHNVETSVKEILEVTGGGVAKAFEVVGGLENFELALRSFGAQGGLLTATLQVPPEASAIRPDVKAETILMYEMLGKEFVLIPGQPPLPANPEARAFFVELCKKTPELITKYGIKGNPMDVRDGLDGVITGLGEMRAGDVSGKKLVYKIA